MSRDPNKPIPGWHNILTNIHHGMVFQNSEQASEYSSACANVLEAVVPGLQALGEMLWTATTCENPIELSEVASVGSLISSLAKLVREVNCNEVNAIRAEMYLAAGKDCYGQERTAEHERIRQEVIAEEFGLEQAA